MGVVTINGQRGSGAPEIGMEVSKRIQYGYVDRQVLAEAATRLGTSEEMLEEKELSAQTGSRVIRVLRRFASEMGTATTGRYPLFYSPINVGQDYHEIMAERNVGKPNLDHRRFLDVTAAVVREIADAGTVVIIGRASNIILQDHPHALHVGLVSGLSSRIALVAQRESLSLDDAKELTIRAEYARLEYFRKYYDVLADDPSHFHLMLNTQLLDQTHAVDIVVASVQSQ